MGAKKKEFEESAFDELTLKIDKDIEPVDLKSKILEYRSKRTHRREVMSGSVILFDQEDRILSKATFKNLSPGGASFEIPPIFIKPQDQIFMGFIRTVNLGTVLCTVQWVREIVGHKKKHKLIGLKFKKLTALQRKELNQYLYGLQLDRKNPVYVGD